MTPTLALSTFLAIAVLVYGLFARSERRLGSTTRQRIGHYLQTERPTHEDQREFARGFLEWFDRAFKVRTRRIPGIGEVPLPSFARSVLVTFVSLGFLAMVWLCNKPGAGRALAHPEAMVVHEQQLARLFFVYAGATIVSNWIPDYLSLIESRMILAKMAAARSWAGRIAWLAVDALATLAISFIAIHLAMVVMLPFVTPGWTIEVGCLTPENYSIATTWELFVAGLTFSSPPGTINYDATGIYIYSTFLTSLWVWIYLGSGVLLRGTRALLKLRRVEPGHALRTMALLAIVSIGSLYWANWLHRRSNGAEVYIEHGEGQAAQALALARELEAQGFWVEIRADVDDEQREVLLRKAEAVLVLADPTLEPTVDELDEQIRCGERPRASVVVAPADIDPALVVEFAKQAPSLLPMGEVRLCRELVGAPLDVEGCD